VSQHRGHHGYGNPADLDRMIARQLAPGRAAWQKPDRVIRAVGIERGHVVADVGAGPGFFTLRLARAVGPGGHVFAVDPEPVVLDRLRGRLAAARVRNVTPVMGLAGDPLLPARSCDVALIVDTYHHFSDGAGFLRRLVRALRPGGLLVNIDFDKRETPVGPPVEHRIAREDFLKHATRARLTLVAEHRFLPYQYFLVFRPR
jgi:ubiquinone/menaquinone biosynthesis C-methylase UbiE